MEQNIFSFQQKKLVYKNIFLLVNLLTPSFIFGLHLNYLIYYWKRYVKNTKPM